MSHELRTPLTAIIGFSQLSLRGAEVANLTTRQKSNLERVLKNGQHLLNLVNDVLDIAKIEAGRMDISHSQLELDPFLQSLIEQTQSLAIEKHLKFTATVNPDIGTIESDPDKLRQILLNLISNALKFTEKGEVSLTARMAPEGPEGFQTGQEWVAISVKDSGIGIPVEKQAQIFEEFYQVDNSSSRMYRGTGSTFTILLPRRPTQDRVGPISLRPTLLNAPSYVATTSTTTVQIVSTALPAFLKEDEALDRAVQTSQELGKKLVISIDDDLDVVDLIQHALEGTSYYGVGLSEPTRALSVITRLKPFAVTLDVMMPQSNGWQVLQQLY